MAEDQLTTTYDDVIGGGDGLAARPDDVEEDSLEDLQAVAAGHPDLAPIQGGDVSGTPAATGTRGEGTGADTGTGGEVGTTRPGGSV